MAMTRWFLCAALLLLCASLVSADEKAVEKVRADNLCAEAQKLYEGGDAEGAMQKWGEACAIYERMDIRWGELRALLKIGEIQNLSNRYEEALATFGKALKLAQQNKERGDALQGIGRAYLSMGKDADALDCYTKALEAARAISDPEEESRCLGNMATVCYSLQQLDDALRYCEEALAIARRIHHESLESVHLGNLGNIRCSRGDYVEALRCYESSMRLCRKIRTQENEAIVLENMGVVSEEHGDYPRSVRAFRRCLEVRKLMADRAGEERILGRIGDAYAGGGGYEQALSAHQEMLTVNRTRRGTQELMGGTILAMESSSPSRAVEQPQEGGERGRRRIEVVSLRRIGRDYRGLGRYPDALKQYEQALALARQTADERGQAESFADMGIVQADMNDANHAMNYFLDGLGIEQHMQNRLGEARSLANIGLALRSLGRYTESLEYLNKALALSREIGYAEGEQVTLGNLAASYEKIGDLEKAREACAQAIELTEKLRRPMHFSEYKATYFAGKLYLYGQMVRILSRLSGGDSRSRPAADAFQYAERSRARVLLDSLAEARAEISQGIPESLVKRHAEFESYYSRLRAVLHKKLAGCPTPEFSGTAGELQEMIETTGKKLRELEAEMSISNPQYKTVRYPEPVSVEDIQRSPALDGDTVLLEYFWSGDDFYLWAVTRENLLFAELGGSERISDMVKSLREDIVLSRCATEKQYQLSRDLYKILVEPAEALRGERRKLKIAADGILSYLPFEILFYADAVPGEDPPCLLNKMDISYVQSATVLHNLKQWDLKRRRDGNLNFLAFACPFLRKLDPASDETAAWALNSAYRGGDRLSLGYIPFTRIEVELIGELFGGGGARLYTERKATEANVKAESGKAFPRYLHFAAHAILNEQEPRFSGLVLALGGDDLEDGFLEMREIFNLKFDADLVVLSACQTGLGKMVKGEGLLGLTRAFMYAGSPSVMASLWPVSDRSTCLLMQRFYGNLLSGQGKSAALREAKLWLAKTSGEDDRGVVLPIKRNLTPYGHAYYWAPFILMGLD